MIELRTVKISRYGEIRLVPDPRMVDVVEDWSKVRSPSRAARRRRQGHPQRICYREIPKAEFYHLPGESMIVAHPVTLDKLRARIAADINCRREAQITDVVLGRPLS